MYAEIHVDISHFDEDNKQRRGTCPNPVKKYLVSYHTAAAAAFIYDNLSVSSYWP